MIAGTTYQIRAQSGSEILKLRASVVAPNFGDASDDEGPILYLVSSQCLGRTRCSLLGLILSRTNRRPRVPLLVNQALSEAEVRPIYSFVLFAPEPSPTAFGSTNAFGPQQQPATNPMFGNVGTNNTGTSPFGSFASPHILRFWC